MSEQYIRYPSNTGGSSGVSSLNGLTGTLTLVAGSGITITPAGNNITIAATGGGSGTVTSVSVATINGFSGTVANPTTTPAISIQTTISGILFGNGTSVAAAIASNFPTLNQNTTGTAANITATSNSTLTTLSALSLPTSQLSGGTNLTDSTAGADGITITNGAGALINSTGASIAQTQSGTSSSGYLSSTDWNTFNGKQSSGNFITSLTGDGTATGPGAAALTLATVNLNVGSFGSSTSIPSFTVNGKGLVTAASGNVVVAPAGTLSGTTLNSTVVTSSLTALGVQSQTLNMGTHQISGVVDPTSAQQAATKNYVDTVASGLQPIQAVTAATTGSNIPGTYVQVGGGIGDTFTTTSTTSPFVLDGVTPSLGQRILFKDQTLGQQNGIYTLTVQAVSGVSGAVFTRALDYDTAADINAGDLIPVISGTVNAQTSWLQTATVTSVGTSGTPLVFVEWTANPANYLLKANNLSDVANAVTAFANIQQPALATTNGTVTLALLAQTSGAWSALGFI